MPNIMIHVEVGNYISKKLNINSYDFFLGLIAPDSPNLEGFAEKDERWTAHQRKADYTEWKKNLKDFYDREKDNYPKDFILGYYVHILTDIVFDDVLYLKVREEILKDGYKSEETHSIMGQDMNKYYFSEIEKIKELLREKEDSYDVLNISKDLLNKWKQKNIIMNNKSVEKPKYITDMVIYTLNEEVFKNLFQEHII